MCPTFQDDRKSDVSMGRNPVPVSIPVLWPCTRPKCFHKTPKDSHGPFKKDRDTHSNLLGRHIDRAKEETNSSTRYSHFFTSVSGIFYKSEKFSDGTSSGVTISVSFSQFK